MFYIIHQSKDSVKQTNYAPVLLIWLQFEVVILLLLASNN